ncbi:hypothetical protein [Lacinutrix algicola]|uniref:hypothetical protein n=1 Tax=Lacinutrix algicola TaxID=342954 RepID=UPI0006E25675|nr:hypothetical protein [Lacinutrix algicola]
MNRLLLFLSFILILSSCSEDDENTITDSFFNGAVTSANNQQLEGIWAIYQIKFEGQISDVPVDFEECGRDFFYFQPQSNYTDYVFNDNYECTPSINMLNWTLSNGVITLDNGSEMEQWVITELTATKLVFKFKFDVDSNGDLKTYEAICNRYEPPMELDSYSATFNWDYTIDNNDKILLEWNGYQGYNQFEKYEIYRLDQNCSTSNPELISTITNVNETSFIDLTPPPYEEICYVFKIYTNQGLLGESNPVNVPTSSLKIPNVNLVEPVLSGNTVQLNWEQYQGYYFSYYEVQVKNYSSGSGGGYQEQQIAVINTIETTNYAFELPYISNPVFVINVYNIFGHKNTYVIEGENQKSTDFVREGILPINSIKYSAFSPDETVLYYSDYSDLYKYNYNTFTVENSTTLNSSSIIFVKVFESNFGTEVIVNIGGTLKVYDGDLNFKYNLQISNPSLNPDHLVIGQSGYWVFADREKLYSFSRTTNNLNLISTQNLYNQYFSSSIINIMDIGLNRILVGNATQSQGLIVDIDSNTGVLSNVTTVNSNLTSEWNNNGLYSQDLAYVLNTEDNTVYSTSTNNLITTLSSNFFASGISNNGNLILGTNNNPVSTTDSFHEKKVRTLSYPDFNEQIYDAKGYPHIVYQNHLGQLISISKGLIGNINGYTPENDIFIEVIE